jgi:chemotaxis response regulator CheB
MPSCGHCPIIGTYRSFEYPFKGIDALTRILMLGCNPLFRESIESLIRQEMEAEIIGRETSIELDMECIETTRPDVIIVDNRDPVFDHGKVISYVLERGLAVKVIGLNLHDSSICIYRGEQKIAKEVKDLMDAIQS